jgi:excisionase family DNA binding protein
MDKNHELNYSTSSGDGGRYPERNAPELTILTLAEVARYLRVHPSTVYRLIEQNKLPAFKVGSSWRINLEAINELRFNNGARARGKKIKAAPQDGG